MVESVVLQRVGVECPDCGHSFSIDVSGSRPPYNYADMYVDHLKGDFDLKKFIESFGRSTLLKAMGEMV